MPVDCGNATHTASINRKNPKINIENARIIDRRVTLQGGFVPKQTLTGNYEKCEKFWTPSLIMQNAMIVVPRRSLLFLKNSKPRHRETGLAGKSLLSQTDALLLQINHNGIFLQLFQEFVRLFLLFRHFYLAMHILAIASTSRNKPANNDIFLKPA